MEAHIVKLFVVLATIDSQLVLGELFGTTWEGQCGTTEKGPEW